MTPAQALYPSAPVLLVDDEEAFLDSASFILNRAGITHTIVCRDSSRVMSMLQQRVFSIILLDLYMPVLPGLELPNSSTFLMCPRRRATTASACASMRPLKAFMLLL